jgi:hypothetical protein
MRKSSKRRSSRKPNFNRMSSVVSDYRTGRRRRPSTLRPTFLKPERPLKTFTIRLSQNKRVTLKKPAVVRLLEKRDLLVNPFLVTRRQLQNPHCQRRRDFKKVMMRKIAAQVKASGGSLTKWRRNRAENRSERSTC